MKAKPAPPERVRSMEGLGRTFYLPAFNDLKSQLSEQWTYDQIKDTRYYLLGEVCLSQSSRGTLMNDCVP